MAQLREPRDALSKKFPREHGTIKNADAMQSETLKLYKQATCDLKNVKKLLKRGRLLKSRAEFFDKIETEDAQRQLSLAVTDLKEEEWKPRQVELGAERTRVAELLCQRTSGFEARQKLQHRVGTIKALYEMCRLPGASAICKPQSHNRD